MSASEPCHLDHPNLSHSDSADGYSWVFVRTEYPDSGHNVTWHQATTDTTNTAPVFQPATISQSTVECCGGWTTVATLRALDADVVQVGGVWQDDLRFASRSDNSNQGVSRLTNARFLSGGGGHDVDVEVSGVSPGTIYITVDVRDLRATATDTIIIGPFTIQPDPDQEPDVSIADVTVTEGETAQVTITSSIGGGTGTVQFATVDGTATAGSDYRSSSGQHTIPGITTRSVILPTIDDDDIEGNETFTVTLTGTDVNVIEDTATVTIIDNDQEPCPAGQTGTPPNCQPATTTTTTPRAASGCGVASARLTALTVTAGGSSVLSGFSATTYSYNASTTASSVEVSATAMAAASVKVGAGRAQSGSDSGTFYVSAGSTTTFEVEVSSGGESCTYTVTVVNTADVDCASLGLFELLDGSCTADPCGPGLLVEVGPDGKVNGCKDIGDCPYDELNDYRYRNPPKRNEPRLYSPQWRPASDTIPAVSAGAPATAVRTVIKCVDLWRSHVSWPVTTPHCFWDELNLHSRGDCLWLSVTVSALHPASSPWQQWWQVVSGCGHNRSAAKLPGWTPADTVCSSADAQWRKSLYWYSGTLQSDTPAGLDPGEWTVTLVDEELNAYGGDVGPVVDVPVRVEVSDWGDASRLVVQVRAMSPHKTLSGCSDLRCGVLRYFGRHAKSATTMFSVPRRSGPPPADDVVEVRIGDLDDRPSDERFVEIDRATLLANDACPLEVDCSDPLRWPVQVIGKGADRCNRGSGRPLPTMLATAQGAVGCDTLNTVGGSVRYWPQMWAAGEDLFRYHAYGGDATVTIRFVDTPPRVSESVTASDLGASLTTASFPRTGSAYKCVRYGWSGCAQNGWVYTVTRDDTTVTGVWHHSAVVPLPVPVDTDGDYAGRRLTDGSANTAVKGRYGIRADMLSNRRGVDFFTETYDAATVQPLGRSCVQWGSSYCRLWVNFGLGGIACLRLDSEGRCDLGGTLDDATARRVGYINYDTNGCTAAEKFETRTHPRGGLQRWLPAGDRCTPADTPSGRLACQTGLGADELCYSAQRLTDQPTVLTIPYLACDDRYLSYLADRRDAEAAGRTTGDYCASGAVTVHLGLPPIEATLDGSRVSAAEGTNLSFGVRLDRAAVEDVVVDYAVTGGTATASDWLAPPGQVTIPAGNAAATIEISTVQDTIVEDDETLTVTLTSVSGADLGSAVAAEGVIIDDDLWAVRSLTARCAAVSGSPRIEIAWEPPEGRAASRYEAQIHTGDPIEATRPFSFLGSRKVAWDTGVESWRRAATFPPRWPNTYSSLAWGGTYTVRMRPAGDGKSVWRHATAACPPAVSLSPSTLTATEDSGPAVFTIRLSNTWASAVSVDVATSDETATAGEDYVRVNRRVTIASGVESVDVRVQITDDTDDEPDESFALTISNPSNATLDTTASSARVTITDNDTSLTPVQQCEALHGPGWGPVLYPNGTPWTDSHGQIVCAMPH